jgi:hypothetical protein
MKYVFYFVFICNICFSQESQYSFIDIYGNEVSDFQIALFLDQNITLKRSTRDKISLNKADIVAADSISLLTNNNLSITLKKEAFNKQEIKINFSV